MNDGSCAEVSEEGERRVYDPVITAQPTKRRQDSGATGGESCGLRCSVRLLALIDREARHDGASARRYF